MIGSRRPEPPLEILEGLRHPVPMEEGSAAEDRRRATIDAMARAIRQGKISDAPHGRSFALWAAAAAAAVLLAGVGWGWAHRTGEGRRLASSGEARSADTGSELRARAGLVATTQGGALAAVPVGSVVPVNKGDEIQVAADGEAILSLPRGVRVQIDGSTKARILAVSEVDQRLRCDLGTTRVSVPKPGGPRSFVVETPDAEVIVHGTEFSVLVERDEPPASTVTSVFVTRGAVLVVYRGNQRLVAAGDHWSSRAAVSPVPSAAGAAPSSSVPSVGSASQVGDVNRTGTRALGVPGSLAEQNRLFRAALDARKNGDDSGAITYLDELLARFPNTTLAEEARLARARSLQRLGRGAKPPSERN